MREIPFAKPVLGDEEIRALESVVNSGWIMQGSRVKKFEETIAKFVGAPHACAVSSCTAAIQLSLLAAGVSPGDVVITVSYSMIATANAIRACFAEPYFVDIEPGTPNMCSSALQQCLIEDFKEQDGELWLRDCNRLKGEQSMLNFSRKPSGRLGAILVVHQVGMPVNLPKIIPLAEKHRIPLIEDAACALGAEISFDCGESWEKIGKPHGDAACFSFHPRKVITTGEGGVITSAKKQMDKDVRLRREHGMTLSTWGRDDHKKFRQEEYLRTGFNFRMTDLQAAIGVVQMGRLNQIVASRKKIGEMYEEGLQNLDHFDAPAIPNNMRVTHQSYMCRVSDPNRQIDIIDQLKSKGINTRPGIPCIHRQIPYRDLWKSMSLPNSEKAQHDRIILPMFPSMTASDVEYIIESLSSLR